MKSLIISVMMFLTSWLSAQDWTTLKLTNINVSAAYSVDIFTNGYGNHIIVQESNSLKYYKMDVNGVAGTPIILENTAVVSPSISGDAAKIYAVYRKNSENFIRTKFSSDGGATWQYISNLNNPVANSVIGSIECIFSNSRLHITFETSNVVYYANYSTQNSNWSSPAIVSTNENGVQPRIAARYTGQSDFVYFLYQKQNTDIGKWRKYNVGTNTWGSLYEGYNLAMYDPMDSYAIGFRIDESKIVIYSIFYGIVGGYNNPVWYTKFYEKDIVNNNWLNEGYLLWGTQQSRITTTTTADMVSHSAFYKTYVSWPFNPLEISDAGIRRSKSGYVGGDSDEAYGYVGDWPSSVYFLNISSAGNDVHIIWKDSFNNSNNLKYVYEDKAPLAPQNLQLSSNSGNLGGQMRVSWTKNSEADISLYEISRKVDILGNNWEVIATTSNNYYLDPLYLYAPGGGDFYVTYKIRAKDVGNKFSPYSNNVGVRAEQLGKKFYAQDKPDDYNLNQNYPNPFNPTTKITYSIKEDGLVSLKVYDILGKEVVTLVNENKPAGNYEVEFNASQLPSGMYIYKIQTNNFSDTKKMILLK
jgi:hypothetical protein